MSLKKVLMLQFISNVLLVTGCSLMSRDEVRKQDEQQRQMKEQMSTIQRSRADADLRYSELQSEQRSLSGRVDALEHGSEQSAQARRQEIEGLKKAIDLQAEKLKVLQEHVDATETRLTAAIQALSGNSSPPVANPPANVAAGASAAATSGPLVDADAKLQSKDFKKAIVSYQAFLEKNPKSKYVPEATYKIGVCFAELGYKKDAKEFYKEVIDNHPSSPWAKKAKYRLSRLK